MKKNVVKFTAMAMVLAAALSLGQSVPMAAPNHGNGIAVAQSTGVGLFDMVLRLLGNIWGTAAAPAPSAPGHSISTSPSTPASNPRPGSIISPDTAIWGRCQAPPCV